ncbi:glycerol-3-phosphate dehydrogenase [Panacibacter ginsenosidivorans]|uniref:Glycerol-3-phosphate dehydrogenase n=1 Tax=Panacibacter ginsenosidivorans TaxID=1813871 RepID=A0A5B8VEA1_9BACT|nr:NAD(P)H-dependent glycerol-3-phosphate dehydrogenase [Panacibacter ginsenosidivorans]QEC69750.1 glycerol-3-phosphate dehydrogenase [Panacibacter ginsenosidivorans]
MLKNIAIIGSGSWATALAKIFSESGIYISWLVRNRDQAEYIRLNKRNPRYLSYAELDLNFIRPTTSMEEAILHAQLIVLAVPSIYLKEIIQSINKDWIHNKAVAVSIKGIIPSSGSTPGLYIRKYFDLREPVLIIGGPCHAEEIGMKRNTYVTISGEDPVWVKKIADSISVPYIRTVTNNDPVGVEYVSILKNIIGIATGIASGLHYGENFQAVLTSNSMREVDSFLSCIHANRSVYDSVYFGDLLVTAYSGFSRNRTLGKLIGRGIHVSHALQAMEMVAEGYNASKELAPMLSDLNISLPVINSVYRILHQHANPFHEFKLLEQQLC